MKKKLSEEGEAQILIINATDLAKQFSDDFVNYRAGMGHIEICKESPKFAITLRLERKKGRNRMGETIVMSKEEAKSKYLSGWNLRCNLCGSYGAKWIPNERPSWGSLCLCPYHEKQLYIEHTRHENELKRLRRINYEQDGR